MSLPPGIKRLAYRIMPGFFLRTVRRWYYPRLVRKFPEERWPWSEAVHRLVRPGDQVVDAGANVGYVSSILSRMVGPDGRVLAFEAFPSTAELLHHNIRCSGLENVKVFPFGLSARSGTASMFVPRYAWGGENFYESSIVDDAGTPGRPDGEAVQVPLEPLDSVLQKENVRPSFIKIDVEGHELDVLQGALGTLAACRPALLVEVNGDPDAEGGKPEQVFALLRDQGYSPYLFQTDKFVPREKSGRSTDYFFLRPEHLSSVV